MLRAFSSSSGSLPCSARMSASTFCCGESSPGWPKRLTPALPSDLHTHMVIVIRLCLKLSCQHAVCQHAARTRIMRDAPGHLQRLGSMR